MPIHLGGVSSSPHAWYRAVPRAKSHPSRQTGDLQDIRTVTVKFLAWPRMRIYVNSSNSWEVV
jgi:hypothetical protein